MADFQKNEETEKALSEEEQKAFWMKAMEENEAIQSHFARYHPT